MFARPQPKELRLCEITFRAIPSLPHAEQFEYPAMEKGHLPEDDESVSELDYFFAGTEFPTKLLGFANQIQMTDLGLISQLGYEQIKHSG